MTEPTLGDLGERRIIAELLAQRYAAGGGRFGDDCASVPMPAVPNGHLVVTTDPCPPPMAAHLGFDDPYYRGWLLATLNLSDLAAAGAEPLGLLTSLQLPASTTIAAFERLLDGIDACCEQQGTRVLGGNLKETPQPDVGATAFGVCDTAPLTRSGARVGDAVIALGEIGSFWAGVLGVQRGLVARDVSNPLLKNVLTPEPKIAAGLECRRAGGLTACMDNSDGLYPSLLQLAAASEVKVVVDGDALTYSDGVAEVARDLETEPLRLALGWGDWQLIGTCRTDALDALGQIAAASQTELHRIGHIEGGAGVQLDYAGRRGPLLRLDSQRFAPDSWFSAGLDAYVELLLNGPLQDPAANI
jgi:thiamine-monophosphate kinase